MMSLTKRTHSTGPGTSEPLSLAQAVATEIAQSETNVSAQQHKLIDTNGGDEEGVQSARKALLGSVV